ncbi:MAG: SAM-dependent methyltransferase [Flavobacteriales bacterium]|jgi:trans-aconitate 2-methyltransferase
MTLESREKIAEFYDSYAQNQKRTGINIRHRMIIKRLKSAGLSAQSTVLEIGCGIGTLTSLLVRQCKHLTAADISPESIAQAKATLDKHDNIAFVVTDMSDFQEDRKYDFIVLPDVLEHIPLEQHPMLFSKMKQLLHENGKICIHVPDPYALEYIRQQTPELLQIIDQSIYSDILVKNIYDNSLTLHRLERYTLQKELPDYQWIEIIHRPHYTQFNKKKYSTAVVDELKARF